jgi:hypothetical protein
LAESRLAEMKKNYEENDWKDSHSNKILLLRMRFQDGRVEKLTKDTQQIYFAFFRVKIAAPSVQVTEFPAAVTPQA